MAGIWATEVAEGFPHSKVRGFDIPPVQNKSQLSNCSFYVADITRDLGDETLFPTGSIDLVHMRYSRLTHLVIRENNPARDQAGTMAKTDGRCISPLETWDWLGAIM
jgi:hypothetical protein